MEIKINPHDKELELEILASAFIDNDSALEIVSKCSESDFYSERYREVFSHIKEQCDKNDIPDYKKIDLDIWMEMQNYFTTANLERNIKQLKRYSHLRTIKDVCLQALNNLNGEPEEIITNIEKELLSLGTFEEDIKHITDFTESVIENWDRFRKTEFVVAKDLYRINDKIRLMSGMPFIFAGLPGSGKSSLMLNMLIANSERVPVLCFSQEMSGQMLNYRSGYTAGKLDLAGYARYESGIEKLKQRKIYVDETPGLTPYQLRSKTLRAVKKYGVKLVALDYLQLAVGEGNNINEREINISQTIMSLSKEADVCWISLSQMHKASFRMGKRNMSDVKGSGQFIQDARGIYFIEATDVEGELDFWCAKQNYGSANWHEHIGFDSVNNIFREIDKHEPFF